MAKKKKEKKKFEREDLFELKKHPREPVQEPEVVEDPTPNDLIDLAAGEIKKKTGPMGSLPIGSSTEKILGLPPTSQEGAPSFNIPNVQPRMDEIQQQLAALQGREKPQSEQILEALLQGIEGLAPVGIGALMGSMTGVGPGAGAALGAGRGAQAIERGRVSKEKEKSESASERSEERKSLRGMLSGIQSFGLKSELQKSKAEFGLEADLEKQGLDFAVQSTKWEMKAKAAGTKREHDIFMEMAKQAGQMNRLEKGFKFDKLLEQHKAGLEGGTFDIENFDPFKLPKALKETLVPGIGFTTQKTIARTLVEDKGKLESTRWLVDDLINISKEWFENLNPISRKKADQAVGRLKALIRIDVTGGGNISEAEQKILNNLAVNPTWWFTWDPASRAALTHFQESLDQTFENKLKASIIKYLPDSSYNPERGGGGAQSVTEEEYNQMSDEQKDEFARSGGEIQ